MEGMHAFHMLEYAAWGLSALFGLWMLIDMIRTNSAYSEDVLTSSKEGEIEDELVIEFEHVCTGNIPAFVLKGFGLETISIIGAVQVISPG